MNLLSHSRNGRVWSVCAFILTALFAVLGITSHGTQPVFAAPEGVNWCVTGSFQGWNNNSDPANDEGLNGDLVANDGVFSLEYAIATAGRHEFKFVECNNWGVAYPVQNSWFYTSSPNQSVTFTFDTNDHSADAGWNAQPAADIVHVNDDGVSSYTAVGDWQGWDNANPATLMTDVGQGIYRLAYNIASPGSYEAKIVQTGSWAEQYVADGRAIDGSSLNFSTSAPNEEVVFLLDTNTSRVTIASNESSAGNWCLAGGFQGWDNASTPLNDDGLNGDLLGGDGIFSLDYTIPNAGRDEFKVVECGNWNNGFPSDNGWVVTTAADQSVKFTFDTNDHSGDVGPAYLPAQNIVNAQDDLPASFTVVGPWQGWDNANPATTMTALGNNRFVLDQAFATPGVYEAKITQTGSWDNQFGADGRHKNAPTVNFEVFNADDTVQFLLDGNHGRWAIVAPPPSGVDDIEPGDELLVLDPVSYSAQEEIFYFVLPDRFEDGDPSNNEGAAAGGTLAETGYKVNDKAFYHGGDFAGLQSQLSYLSDLGVTALWITPPFENLATQPDGSTAEGIGGAYHGYWILDYENADPHLGSNQELINLIDAAHGQGIKVYFDIVVNHTADVIQYVEGTSAYRGKEDYPYLDANGEPFDDRDFAGDPTFPALDPAVSFPYTPEFANPGDETLKNPAWLNNPIYYHNRGDSSFAGESSEYGDFFGLDDTFTEHPDVVAGYIDIFKNAIDTYDIDGFRIDTVKHVNIALWQELAPEVMAYAEAQGKPDFYMYGEVFDGNPANLSTYTTEGNLPSVLDFGLHGNASGFAVYGNNTDDLRDFFAQDDYYTDADSNAYGLGNFISNHDIGRIGKAIQDTTGAVSDAEMVARSELAHGLMFFARGFPVIYYGDEQGFTGDGGDKDAREDMMPSQVAVYNDNNLIGTTATTADSNFDQTHPLYQTLADYAALRAAHPALSYGAQIHRYSEASAGLYAFSRIERNEQVEYLVVLNNASGSDTASFSTDSPNTTFTEIYPGGGAALVSDGSGDVTVTADGLSVAVYRADQPVALGTTPIPVTINTPAADSEVVGRVEVGATLGSDQLAEVTFAVSIDGGAYESIGVDTNAPYRIFYDVSQLAAGTEVTFKAIVNNLNGNLSSTKVSTTVGEDAPPAGDEYVIFHYYRPDGDYGDFSSSDFNDFWGLHLWGEALDPAELPTWTEPVKFTGFDEYGAYVAVRLIDDSHPVNFIVHRGNTKDGTESDRAFDPAVSREVWLVADDANHYYSRAEALGQTVVHYNRPDSSYDGWGLHLWQDGNGLTTWPDRKLSDGTDEYGAFYTISTAEFSTLQLDQTLNFIMHDGQDNKDTDGDRAYEPSVNYEIWLKSGDEAVYTQEGAATGDYGEVTIHYRRCFGDYGDPTSPNYQDFWGLHTWAAAVDPGWTTPRLPAGQDSFGIYFEVPLINDQDLNYILHRGDEKDVPDDQTLDLSEKGYEIWIVQNDEGTQHTSPAVAMHAAGEVCDTAAGDLGEQRAYWLTEELIGWNAQADPNSIASYQLYYAPDGGLLLDENGISGGSALDLTEGSSLPPAVTDKFPHLASQQPLLIDPADLAMVPDLLKGQIAVAAFDSSGELLDATGLQIPGVLDDLYTYDGDLGVSWDENGEPTIRVWAPTAQNVTFHLFADSDPATTSTTTPMNYDPATGVWSIEGDASWKGQYYLYEVEVFVNSTGAVEHNIVTDPYSHSLAMNSTRSQIVDLRDAALKPAGWDGVSKPDLVAPEEITIYELHVRDFSIYDQTVAPEDRGTFKAFTYENSDGMLHLKALAEAGLSHLHLLPVFDIATINEDKSAQNNPDPAVLATYPPDSDQQQAAIAAVADQDGFNWGYDPFHYTVPEGSYSTNPDGPTRIVEFREMVQNVNGNGMRVVMDVVYNHTNASGQAEKSVLDKIVPGYYHRLNDRGQVERSTCCDNTASEHAMFEKLMIDSLVTWAVQYKVDAFRFDLMGHHMVSNMLNIRAALDELTLEEHGVDGKAIYLYGEGWNFGEVANNARGVNATQFNLAGTGIGTFSDRMRDAIRGGGCCPDGQALFAQGFGNGLYTDPNANDTRPATEQLDELLLFSDQVRLEMAGNLASYEFIDRHGDLVNGTGIPYGGGPAGYATDPQEILSYVSKHDNQTLYDINAFGLPAATPMSERVRAQALGLSTVMYGQGVPFFHAGVDLLRSKSLDRDSFNSGDWFNALDFTYQENGFGKGLPIAEKNQSNWPLMQPLLADPALQAGVDAITLMNEMFREMLTIRSSSKLFRLETAAEIQARQVYHNTGPNQIPGLIVMTISDTVGDDLDPLHNQLVVLINASDEAQTFTAAALAGTDLYLHPVLMDSVDAVVKSTSYDATTGTFTIPGRTSAVFVEYESPSELIETLRDDVDALVAAGSLPAHKADRLYAKLDEALAKIADGDLNAALKQLENFIKFVEQSVQKDGLPAAEGDKLIWKAELVIFLLTT